MEVLGGRSKSLDRCSLNGSVGSNKRNHLAIKRASSCHELDETEVFAFRWPVKCYSNKRRAKKPSPNERNQVTKDRPKFICICGQEFASSFRLSKHRFKCGVSFKCIFCNLVTQSENYFMRHLNFFHRDDLKKALFKESDRKSSKKIKCGCGFMAQSRHEMTIHRRLDCSFLFKCTKCPFTAKLQSEVITHCVKTHFTYYLTTAFKKTSIIKSDISPKLEPCNESYRLNGGFTPIEEKIRNDAVTSTSADHSEGSDSDVSLYFDNVCQNALPVSRFGDIPLRSMAIASDNRSRSVEIKNETDADGYTDDDLKKYGLPSLKVVLSPIRITEDELSKVNDDSNKLNSESDNDTEVSFSSKTPSSAESEIIGFRGFFAVRTYATSKTDFFSRHYFC